jgi:putative tricarboxylic transport membrane protein
MDTLQYLMQGFGVALTPTNLMVAAIGALIGTIVGMLPGLGPINGVALLMPLAFALKLPAHTALILLTAVYIGCEFGGRISSILLNVPGDAGAIMTAIDGHPMARTGRGGVALSISAWASFVGSTIATAGIVLFAPLLARWALAFGPAEYFALMCFAFACITGLMGSEPLKAVVAAALGLALSTVGLDSNSGIYRFTGDNVHLSDGIQFIVVVIGLFSVSEILVMLEHQANTSGLIRTVGRVMFSSKEFMLTGWTIIRSSVIGFVVGVLPGAGATIASAMAYSVEKRLNDKEGTFGTGDIRGVSAPEAANNASANGSFIPMLTLGVPGSGTTAVMVGALSLYNITPGPALFTQQPELVWGLIASMFISNFLLLIINIPLVGVFTRLLLVPNWLLVPGILAISAVGVYSIHATTFDLLLMGVLGIIGFGLRKGGLPMAPLILGFVLGDLMEQNLRRALSITNGELSILWSSPISIGLWAGVVVMLAGPPAYRRWSQRKLVMG